MASPAPCIGGGPHGNRATCGETMVRVLFAAGAEIAAGPRHATASRGAGSRHPALCHPLHRGADVRPARLPRSHRALAGRPAAGVPSPEGSHRRQKARLLLAGMHERIRNIRQDHAHKLSRRLVADFGFIAVEDLNVGGLARGPLAKDVTDQGWAAFLTMLEYKAAEAGTRLIRVPPHGTSQTCSGCGIVVPKLLSERMHQCPDCGLVIDRDANAARNILRLGLSRQASTWPTGACVA